MSTFRKIPRVPTSLPLAVFVLCSLQIIRSRGYYQPELLSDLHLGATITANNACKDNQSCVNSFTKSECQALGICQPECPNGSRRSYPEVMILTDSTTCQGDNPSGPAAANLSNGHFFTNSNNSCTLNRTVTHPSTGNFAISFWIKGMCNPNCTVLKFGFAVYLADDGREGVKLDISNSSWTHVVIMKRFGNNTLEVFQNNMKTTVTTPPYPGSVQEQISIGSSAMKGEDFLSILDARFYSDRLTTREVHSLYNGTVLPVSECRCPDVAPDGVCPLLFYDAHVMLDDIATTSWASSKTDDVLITVDLGNTFQIKEVVIAFKTNGSTPISAVWKFERRGQTEHPNNSGYTCTNTACNLTSNTTYIHTVAERIHIELLQAGTDGGYRYYIIEDINISGWCDCNGAVSNCSKMSGSPNYTCDCETKSGLPHCRQCTCESAGTRPGNDTCDSSGKCSCKNNTQGVMCDECKPGYFGLNITNPDGCSACECNMAWAINSACDKTSGQCDCRGGDYTNRQCIPVVNSFEPKFGPVSGGTLVSMKGHYLGAGAIVTIGGVVQEKLNSSDTEVSFKTSAYNAMGTVNISVELNGTLISHQFDYRPDPTIVSITEPIRTSPSGGCIVTVTGTNLNSVKSPIMKMNVTTETSVCKHVGDDGKSITCAAPPDKSPRVIEDIVDVQLDGVVRSKTTRVIISEDAEIPENHLTFQPPFEKTITITGTKLGTDCNEKDYMVYVGSMSDECTISTFSESQIVCMPPEDEPTSKSVDTKGKYDILVQIGFREVQKIGIITYMPVWKTNYFVYIVCGSVTFLTLFVTMCCCLFYCCRRNNYTDDSRITTITEIKDNQNHIPLQERFSASSYEPLHPHDLKLATVDLDEFDGQKICGYDNLTTSIEAFNVQEKFLSMVDASMVDEVQAALIEEKSFAPGNICVAKGDHVRLIDGSFTAASAFGETKITIKMLKEPLSASDLLPKHYTLSLNECLRLKPHRDDKVLSIHGIGVDKSRFYIIYPYMGKRTLKDHIVDVKQSFVLRQLLEFALQVCEGMEFLSSRNIVHKDIAARNCMVDATDNVKISDSAFSWDFYPDEYMYDSLKDRYLPVRWMALESLTSGFYDTKSDVWSFGVMMWELLTLGVLPFHEVTENDKLQSYIQAGYRLGQPNLLADDTYDIMRACWVEDGEERPNFKTLEVKVAAALTGRETDEELYMNTQAVQGVYTYIQ